MRVRFGYLVTGLVLVVGLLGGLAAFTATVPDATQPEPSLYRSGANQTSEFGVAIREAGFESQVIVSTTRLVGTLERPGQALVILPAPERAPTADEAATLDAFLAAGGSLWIADGRGAMNAWLRDHGASIAAVRLLDPGSEDPRVVALEPQALEGVGDAVFADAPGRGYVDDDGSWTVVLQAPARVHIDLDGNGSVDRSDTPGPHAVALERDLPGGGRLLVMADDSLLRDRNMERPEADNAAFVQAMLRRLLPSGGDVFVDEAGQGLQDREPYAAPLVRAALLFKGLGLGTTIAAVATLAATVLALAYFGPRWAAYRPHETRIPIDPAPELGPAAHVAAAQASPETTNVGERTA